MRTIASQTLAGLALFAAFFVAGQAAVRTARGQG